MRRIALMMMLALAGCTTAPVEPIPGSITYGGQPRTKLTKSPIGSTLSHEFIMGDGRLAIETYRIQPDRSLSLENRVIVGDWPPQ
ncbi:hypothetical protein [Rhizobium sp. RM]|uniref:hypothetical protein n=1 Tax=Rhizobium/Agrobacterium group TaxID=227290 RepID=UPI00110D6474|nr:MULTISPECIES: hypothetical protein [Rhizobium/Agrobacterium group]NWJ27019.1 hypothetical protein [Rhizobium sp. RM]TMV22879.1 hypothetical protein BJG94_02620 [Rhizobium sp. Td3]UXS02349.1 hypothetical protein FY156_13175 [Agrobacterium tumefaciens]